MSVLKKSWSLRTRTRSRTVVLKREFMVGWLPAESRTLTSWNEFSGMQYTSYFIDSDRLWSLQQAGPPSYPGVSKLSWTTAAHLPWLHGRVVEGLVPAMPADTFLTPQKYGRQMRPSPSTDFVSRLSDPHCGCTLWELDSSLTKHNTDCNDMYFR